jgi:hypothetical protein
MTWMIENLTVLVSATGTTSTLVVSDIVYKNSVVIFLGDYSCILVRVVSMEYTSYMETSVTEK